MTKKTNVVINWWITKHGDIYLLHGNNATTDGSLDAFPFALIETSRVLKIEISDNGFIFKTLNGHYFCEAKTSLDNRFEWLRDKSLWEKPLNDMQFEICEGVITGFQAQRIEVDKRALVRKIMPKAHIEVLLSDKSDDYLVYAKYVNDNGEEYVMEKQSMAQRVYLKYLSDEKDIYREFEIIDNNVINLGTKIWNTPILIVNVGGESMRIETSIGSFWVPEDRCAYLISPAVFRGRIPVYE